MKLKQILSLIILNSALLISFSSCYTWFEEKKPMDTDTPQTGLKDFLHEDEKITSLEAPVQVIASKGLYNNAVKLSWTPVEHAATYRVERAVVKPDSNGTYVVPEEGDFELLEKQVFKNSYSDVILTNPLSTSEEYSFKYYYRISAENIYKGLESSDYTDISNDATKALGWLLPAPANLEASKGDSTTEIKLKWNPVDGASSYEIFRGKNADGTGMEKIATILANTSSYVNAVSESDQGTNFYYKVCAKLSNGSESAFTTLALGYSLKPGAPAAPANLRVSDGLGLNTDSLKVEWEKVTSATGTVTYALYRTSSADSVFTLVRNNIPQDTTSVTVSDGLKTGIKYYFYLQTTVEEASGEKIKSAFTKTGPDAEAPAVGFLLSAPSDVEIAEAETAGKIYLRWTPSVGYDLLPEGTEFSYNIYSDSNMDGEFTDLVDYDISGLPLGEDGYYQMELDKKDFLKVSTVNAYGTESPKSYIVAPFPSAPSKVTATKTSGADGLLNYAPNNNEVYPVKISWEAPAGETLGGYHVYRATSPDASFRKLTDTPVTGNSFIDENETARAGTIYYYKVVSLNVLGQGKKSNDPSKGTDCQGYGAVTRDQWFREYNKSIMKSQSKLTLMHKANDMDKLGSETINGEFGGTLSYKASIAGLGAEITMHYQDYCDFMVNGSPYYVLTGNTDTTSNMSANGNMHEKVTCTGMYPGYAIYNNLQIKGGAAGGGYYLVETSDLSGKTLLKEDKVNWTVGEEH